MRHIYAMLMVLTMLMVSAAPAQALHRETEWLLGGGPQRLVMAPVQDFCNDPHNSNCEQIEDACEKHLGAECIGERPDDGSVEDEREEDSQADCVEAAHDHELCADHHVH